MKCPEGVDHYSIHVSKFHMFNWEWFCAFVSADLNLIVVC
jgi:hypothetical protein